MKTARTTGVSSSSASGHSDADSVSAEEILVEQGPETNGRNPGSPGLTALLGLSLVVYGSVISFLVARLVTYENYERARSLGTPQNFPLLIPFVLSPIVIYVVMEFWRVANTDPGVAVTTGWFLYDILALLFALLALQGFQAGMQVIPIHLPPQVFQDVIQKFCGRIAFGCLCLAFFLALAVGRFWGTFGFRTQGLVIVVDSLGAVMSLAAAYFLMRQPPRYFLVFFMTSSGFLLAVGYLLAILLQ